MAPADANPAPRLSLSIQLGDGVAELPADRARLRRLALASLDGDAALTLRFVDSAEGRTLNRDFRGKDYATNVLTFEYGEHDGTAMADIVICMPVVRDEAAAQGKPVDDHLAHLVVHGVLHAQGWDHLEDDEAEAMEARERAVLARFRIADPYRDDVEAIPD